MSSGARAVKSTAEMMPLMPVKDLTDPTFAGRTAIDEIERVIVSGRNQRPAFGGLLSAPKIRAVAGHAWRLGDR